MQINTADTGNILFGEHAQCEASCSKQDSFKTNNSDIFTLWLINSGPKIRTVDIYIDALLALLLGLWVDHVASVRASLAGLHIC